MQHAAHELDKLAPYVLITWVARPDAWAWGERDRQEKRPDLGPTIWHTSLSAAGGKGEECNQNTFPLLGAQARPS